MGLVLANLGDLGLQEAVSSLGVLLLLLEHIILAIHVDHSGNGT